MFRPLQRLSTVEIRAKTLIIKQTGWQMHWHAFWGVRGDHVVRFLQIHQTYDNYDSTYVTIVSGWDPPRQILGFLHQKMTKIP
jgi:hypothetical protein